MAITSEETARLFRELADDEFYRGIPGDHGMLLRIIQLLEAILAELKQ